MAEARAAQLASRSLTVGHCPRRYSGGAPGARRLITPSCSSNTPLPRRQLPPSLPPGNAPRAAERPTAAYNPLAPSAASGSLSSGDSDGGLLQQPYESQGQQQQPRDQGLDRAVNLGVLGAAAVAAAAAVLTADGGAWGLYQAHVASDPIGTKAVISGVVYALGDLLAQSYEGRNAGQWDRARVLRSGLCGLLAHGPLSHLYYVALDSAFMQQTLIPLDSLAVPLLKVAIDQTVWSIFWNSTYYALLGAMKLESPALILATIRSSWWDLLKAGWRIWPLVHLVTYGLMPVQHRLLFVDAVELVWVSILSVYGQQQRKKLAAAGAAVAADGGPPAVMACALPGVDGEGGDPAEEILRGMQVESRIVLQDSEGHETVLEPAVVYAAAAAAEADAAGGVSQQ